MKTPILIYEEQGEKRFSYPAELASQIITHSYLYLQPNGWFSDHPCDEEGVTPWMTFPAISFLKDILSKETKVFEFGSGYSTIFFNNFVGETVSVEHNPEWRTKVLEQVPHANIHLVPENSEIYPAAYPYAENFKNNFQQIRTDNREHDLKHGLINDEFAGYASTIFMYPKGHFDVIVLDGMARSLTGVMAVQQAKEDAIIILDNSDRWHYNPLQEFLINQGYKRIDFWGPGFNTYGWCTSVFTKNFNFKNNRLLRPVKEGPILR